MSAVHILLSDVAVALGYIFDYYTQIVFQMVYLYIFFILDSLLRRMGSSKVGEIYTIFVKQLQSNLGGRPS